MRQRLIARTLGIYGRKVQFVSISFGFEIFIEMILFVRTYIHTKPLPWLDSYLEYLSSTDCCFKDDNNKQCFKSMSFIVWLIFDNN